MTARISADDIITQINRTPLAENVEMYLGNFGIKILREVVDLMGTDATDMTRKQCVETILTETFDNLVIAELDVNTPNPDIANALTNPVSDFPQEPTVADWEKVINGTMPDPRDASYTNITPLPDQDSEPTVEAEEAPCAHEDISWHGLRAECQACGENIPSADYGVQHDSAEEVRTAKLALVAMLMDAQSTRMTELAIFAYRSRSVSPEMCERVLELLNNEEFIAFYASKGEAGSER